MAEGREILAEHDRTSALSVLSALEASFRVDYLLRVDRRSKDGLSLRLRERHRERGHRTSLEDILAAWLEERPALRPTVNHILDALHYRHWLAHGRYWTLKKSRPYDYYELSVLAARVDATFALKTDPV